MFLGEMVRYFTLAPGGPRAEYGVRHPPGAVDHPPLPSMGTPLRETVDSQTLTHAPGWWLIRVEDCGCATAGPSFTDLDSAMVEASIALGRASIAEVHVLSTRAGGERTTLRRAPKAG